MKAILAKIPTGAALVRLGIMLEITGIVLLSIPFFVQIPLVLTVCIPGGAGLLALGWLAWAWAFVKSL